MNHVGNPVARVGAPLSKEQLDQIIEEIAGYEVNLEEDPTLPNLGTPYLQRIISKCRAYQNRVQYYIQIVKMHEKKIRLDLRQRELDLDFKMKEKLADDALVRKQPSVRDREALAATMLAAEHQILADLKVELIDIEETVKLIRSKYDQLKQTSNDIRMQRVLIKDDKEAQVLGGEGYSRPQSGPRGFVPDGMPAPVVPRVEPTDLLDPAKRPDDMPEPLDEGHASMMAAFLNSHPKQYPAWTCGTCGEAVKLNPNQPLVCPKGHKGLCGECGSQQLFSPSGMHCQNGHGGADTRMSVEAPPPPEPELPQKKAVSYQDLLGD
jgi:hypothetical protein